MNDNGPARGGREHGNVVNVPGNLTARCSYASRWEVPHCPFEPEPGKDRCIFHLPVDQKDPSDFWLHLGSYLLALHEKAGNAETAKAKQEARAWFFRERSDHLYNRYLKVVNNGQAWDFTGFVFPRMDNTHDFAEFVFAEAYFSDATFSDGAHFSAARFSAGAIFQDTRLNAGADFSDATFSGPAIFWDAMFSAEAQFWGTRFGAGAHFRGVRFGAEADFSDATFGAEADFSFVRFRAPPSFYGAEFTARADFYEARLPGLGKADDERTARSIRLLAERHGSYADAGDFYMIEMGFRRKRFRSTPGRWFQYVLMELYRLSSRYGESPGRAFVSLLTGLLLFSYAFVIAGFKFMGQTVNRDLRFVWAARWATLSDVWLAVRLALANLMPGNLRGDVMGLELTTQATKTWAVVQVIATYILLTLLLLAIRRRFRR